MSYQPAAAFAGLFRAFTGEAESVGSLLTQQMNGQSADAPMLVSTASDIVLFPGAGGPPRFESFRKSTRGFIELTAVSHLPLALAYLARMRELGQRDSDSVKSVESLIWHAQQAQSANTLEMWRDHVALRAFQGREQKIVEMVDYTAATTIAYLRRAQSDPSVLDFVALRSGYLDAARDLLPVSMNEVMFATFCLAYIDIAYRIGNWLRELRIDWSRAMVLVSGQSGRPTAGATWSSNNICHLIHSSADGALPADRLYVAPHAPGFSVADMPDAQGLVTLEQSYRRLWCHTRASVEVSRQAFEGYPAYQFSPDELPGMPVIRSVDDHATCVARLRRIMEDPQQLLSNCVADYVVDGLRLSGNRPEEVPIPGFSNVNFAKH